MQRPLDERIKYINPFEIAPWCYISPTLFAIGAALHMTGKVANPRMSEDKENEIIKHLNILEQLVPQKYRPNIWAEVGKRMEDAYNQAIQYCVTLEFTGLNKEAMVSSSGNQNAILQPMHHTKKECKTLAGFVRQELETHFRSCDLLAKYSDSIRPSTVTVEDVTRKNSDVRTQTIGSSHDWSEGNIRTYNIVISLARVPTFIICTSQNNGFADFLENLIPTLQKRLEEKEDRSLADLRKIHISDRQL